MFLECDESAKEPIATTVGDTPPREILHYVSHHIMLTLILCVYMCACICSLVSMASSACNIVLLGGVWGLWGYRPGLWDLVPHV